jgi:hypothetical protein
MENLSQGKHDELSILSSPYCGDAGRRLVSASVPSCSVSGFYTSANFESNPTARDLIWSEKYGTQTKRRLLYLKTQSVPRSKHFSCRV